MIITKKIHDIVLQNQNLWNRRHTLVKASPCSLFHNLTHAIPVCWFGDLASSLPKVITIGTNPSSKEFYKTNRFSPALPSSSTADLIYSYNGYFTRSPYKLWFDKIEPLLNEFGASYYTNLAKSYKCTAIHLDVVSFPFWKSKDLRNEKNVISSCVPLFRDLLDEILNNDNVKYIVISGSYNYNLFCDVCGIATSKMVPFIFGGRNYKIMKTGYKGIPVYATTLYLPNLYGNLNYSNLYTAMITL